MASRRLHHVGAAKIEIPSTLTSCRREGGFPSGTTGETWTRPGTVRPGMASATGAVAASGMGSWKATARAVCQSPCGYLPLCART